MEQARIVVFEEPQRLKVRTPESDDGSPPHVAFYDIHPIGRCEALTWTAEEWAEIPEGERPTEAAPMSGGHWIILRPCASPSSPQQPPSHPS
jgi:hypothetical protein